MKAYNDCDFLYIGITNPDSQKTQYNQLDPNRSLKNSNPFTYYHRMRMIIDLLNDKEISKNSYQIIPFPINFPELILNYAPQDAIYYITVLTNDNNDDWNYKKVEILKNLGLEVKIIQSNRKISATTIRNKIKNGEEWRSDVPISVYNYISSHNLTKEKIIK